MRKSTKVFLLIGSIPILVGLVGLILGEIFYAVGCTTNFCESVSYLHWFLLMGIPAILVAFICAGIYSFIYNKLPNSKSETARSLISLFILGAIVLVLFVGYSTIQDKQTAKNNTNWEIQKSICAKSVQLREEDCITQDGTLSKTCEVVIIYGESGTESSYYVDSGLYESCLKNPPAS